MKKILVLLITFSLLFVGCGGEVESNSISTELYPTTVVDEPPEVIPTEEPDVIISNAAERLLVDLKIDSPGLHQDRTALVAASGNCVACHSGLRDADGNDVSFDSKWLYQASKVRRPG